MLKRKPKIAGKRRTLEDFSHSELVSALDDEISFYVRTKEVLKSGNPLILCYTCDTRAHWKSMDAGHYINRTRFGTRFDPRNIRSQCTKCNKYNEGEHWLFRKRLSVELGEAEIQKLEGLAETWGSQRHSRDWLIEQIKLWRENNKNRRKEVEEIDGRY